jgi:CII-binding regulator of phage lambda lysogenization HflD
MELLMEPNMMVMVWNAGLTILLGVLGFVAKEKSSEIQRLNILLNVTREEIARDNVTNQEVDKIMAHIDQRFNKLENKIDELMSKRYAQQQ